MIGKHKEQAVDPLVIRSTDIRSSKGGIPQKKKLGHKIDKCYPPLAGKSSRRDVARWG